MYTTAKPKTAMKTISLAFIASEAFIPHYPPQNIIVGEWETLNDGQKEMRVASEKQVRNELYKLDMAAATAYIQSTGEKKFKVFTLSGTYVYVKGYKHSLKVAKEIISATIAGYKIVI